MNTQGTEGQAFSPSNKASSSECVRDPSSRAPLTVAITQRGHPCDRWHALGWLRGPPIGFGRNWQLDASPYDGSRWASTSKELSNQGREMLDGLDFGHLKARLAHLARDPRRNVGDPRSRP